MHPFHSDPKNQEPMRAVKVWICPDCGYKASCQFNLEAHVKIHLGEQREQPHGCSVCGKSFCDIRSLNRHLKTHRQQRERHYGCHLCKRRFYEKGQLRQHLKIHTTGEQRGPFSCGRCERRFIDTASLEIHVNMHLGDTEGNKPLFICALCKMRSEERV